jgi:hypothetical protein
MRAIQRNNGQRTIQPFYAIAAARQSIRAAI